MSDKILERMEERRKVKDQNAKEKRGSDSRRCL